MSFPRLLLTAATFFAGYVLGARAGHGRYRHIKKNAKTLWGSSGVRAARKSARRSARKLSRRLTR